MIADTLTQKSLSVFTAVGGWRTIAEAVASKAVFAVVHLLTGEVALSALVAVGGVLVFAMVRACTDRKYWQAAAGLVPVCAGAALAGYTGHGVDFYLPSLLLPAAASVVFLLSMLAGWPMAGVVVGAVRGERFGWRRDRTRRRRYQACTAVFLAKFLVTLAVKAPLYLDGQVVPLAIASTVLGPPTLGACVYLCWRIIR